MQMERLGRFLDVYQFSLGSIAYCVDRMRSTLEELGNSEAVGRAETATEKYERARKLQYDWDQQKKKSPLQREGTKQLDNRIDETLSMLLQSAEVYADLDREIEQKELAGELVDELFPSGVYPITSQTFDDQHEAVNELLRRLDDSFSEHVNKLNLGPLVDQLRSLNEEFGDRLEPADEGVSHDQVEEAYVAAEDAFHALLVKVMSDYADDMETLSRVFTPVLEQTERTRRHLQRRGTIPDVDPETGEAVESEGGGGADARAISEASDGETPGSGRAPEGARPSGTASDADSSDSARPSGE